MSDIEVLTVPRSPLKQFDDNMMNTLLSSPRKEATDDEDMSTENLMESPIKRDDNTSRTFEEIRQLIDPTLFTKICEAVHHDKSSNTLEDEVEEVMEEVIPHFYPKEVVHIKSQGTSQSGTILSTEKRGAMRFYYLTVDGSKLPNKMEASAIRRKYSPSEKDIRILLENITEKEQGKPWQVKETVRKEFNVKDKFASIFCTPKNKKGPTTTGRSEEVATASSSEDENPSNARRLSGFAPTKKNTKKNTQPKEAKKTPKPKKEKEEKPEKSKGKEKDKEKEQKEKKPRKQREKKEKDKGMEKFVNKRNSVETPGSASATPFMTPQKRGERRLITVSQKLSDSWRKRDYPEFLKAAAWSAKVLSGVQIDTITNDIFRMAVKKIFEGEKDKNHLKKLAKDKKKEYREKTMAARKTAYKRVDAKIKAHFSGKEIVEDLTLSDNPLPCPGRPITFTDNRGAHFSNCMQMIQFLSSLRQYVDIEDTTTAEDLCNGIHEGRPGYYKHTVKVFLPLIKTLLQDVEYKLHTHFDARLREFNIHECNVSELCRALLIGKTKKDKSGKIPGYVYHADDEYESDEDDKASMKSGCMEKANGSIKDDSTGPEGAKGPKEEVQENGENHVKDEPMEDGEGREKSNEVSQEEMGEEELLLSKFTANHEIWQLEPAVQMDLMRILFYRVLELESCRDFLTEDIISDEAASLKSRVAKHQSQLEEWRETLTKLPEYDDNIDASTLSRHQTRERAEVARKRDNLEKKIEDCEDKLEELMDKIATEKMLQAQSKRLSCIGEDRHCRRYYWVPHKSADAGVWIQDFGTTNFEKFVKNCIEEGMSLDEDFGAQLENGGTAKLMKRCLNESTYEEENWFRVEDISALKSFTSSLSNGMRERGLKNFLTNNMDLIMKAIRHGSQDTSQSATPEERKPESEEEAKTEVVISPEPLDYLITTVVNLYSDMRDGYLTSLDPADFEPKVVSCQTLEAVKDCIVQLVDTVNPSNIIVKLTQKESRETGSYSWFVLDKWKARLSTTQNASAVHLLLSFFESRIDWKNSVRDKRCSVCNSKRSPEAKMACSGCELICHYYCCRPRFLEKPSTWSCAACNRKNVLQARAAKSKPKYVETDTEDEEEEEEDDVVVEEEQEEADETAEQSQDSVDSDVFAADSDEEKHTPMQVPGHTKKRRIVESDEDGEPQQHIDPGDYGRSRSSRIAKRHKASEPLSEVKEILEKLKATRMYRTLLNVPQPRRTRGQNSLATLETIESGLSDYESFEGFVKDLRGFLDHAREYFENHNERKLDELDELLMSLNLPEVQ